LRRHQKAKAISLRLLYFSSSTMVVLSDAGKERLQEVFSIPERKLHVIPHGAFAFPNWSPIPGSNRLLAFGSVRRNKNVLEVIRAVKDVREHGLQVQLVLAGGADRSDPYCRLCLEEMRGDGSGFVDRIGFVADAEIPDLIATIDAFILAYDGFESQSGVAIMAGLNGRPVVTSFAGGIGELRRIGLAGIEIAAPISASSIASAIRQFYSVPIERWRSLADRGKGQMSDALDWTLIGERYLAL
jgi:glycosyltransferase involved in cell wall biosynthesis